MSKLTVSEINTPSNTDPLFFRTGNTNGAFFKVEAANDDILFGGTLRNTTMTQSFGQANVAFDQANSVAISANSWANTLYISALQNANNDANSSNSYADTLYISALQNANNDANASNSYADTLYISALQNANNDANSSNFYAITIGAAANTWSNTKLANASGTFAGNLTVSGNILTTGSLGGYTYFINRQGSAASGISWYSSGYTSWCEYMSPAGATNVGPTGNITAPSGTLVTSWALRSFIENSSGYGWTWEAGSATGQPSVVAELASATGNFRTTGSVIATSATLGTHHSVDVNGFIVRCGGGNYNVRMYPGGGTDTAASILQFTNAAQNAQWGSLYQSNTSMGLGTDLSVPLYFRTGGTNRLYVDSTGHVLPAASNTYDLGASTARWRNIFTGDLHLANDHGDWTIVEGEDELFLYNNKKDKVYKFNLTEVDKSEAPPKKG